MNSKQYKFRAWSGNKMEYSVGISPEGAFYYGGKMKEDSACFNHTLYDENTPIMPFSGLKDEAGQDIWDGDIINTMSNRYVVYFEDGCFMARSLFYGAESHFTLDAISCYAFVIGNIYEDSELLK